MNNHENIDSFKVFQLLMNHVSDTKCQMNINKFFQTTLNAEIQFVNHCQRLPKYIYKSEVQTNWLVKKFRFSVLQLHYGAIDQLCKWQNFRTRELELNGVYNLKREKLGILEMK